jgi:hypothetical protein
VLQTGRTAPVGSRQQHQISWRVDSIKDILKYHKRSRELGIHFQQEVTHGNAIGIYFFDPDENRNEVYLRIDKDVRQPFRKTLDLEPTQIFAGLERLLGEGGPA